MHKTLERQIIRVYGSLDNLPKEAEALVTEISKTYGDYDKEHSLIDRSLEISSEELTGLLDTLSKTNKEIEKKVEERTAELAQEKSKLNQIAENMTVGAILIDRIGNVLFVNNEAKKIIGLGEGDIKTALDSLYKKFDDPLVEQATKKCISGEESDLSEIECGGAIYKLAFKSVYNEDGSTFGHLIWIRDITEEKLLDRSKSELVAVASHQLRTPLTVTKGNTEMLLDKSFGDLNEEQEIVLNHMAEANDRLITLVNEMLDITKIEKNKLHMSVVKIDVLEIVESVIESLENHAKKHGTDICFTKTDGEVPLIMGDEMRVRQIFQNLTENAIQYNRKTGNGECSIKIDLVVNESNVEVSVKDSGIGIPVPEQGKIFERFYRATNSVKFASSGTGLGLYIAKSIIDKLGGSIRFESEENKGTTFFVTFPIADYKKQL
ncbi:MAG: two-component system phosphate regulon sensor histidine kinase PhoR [Candidatus Paceibacteria bacterium]|jgi:two-component system phosphate regulon sensor histidine kinase PhoR